MFDLAEKRLDFAKENSICTNSINASDPDWKNKLINLCPYGVDLVIDAVGNQVANCVEIVQRGGKVILFGLRPNDNQTVNQYQITRKDVTVMGSFVGLNPFIQTIKLLESQVFDFSKIITHKLPLSELEKGITLMRSREGMKVIIETDR